MDEQRKKGKKLEEVNPLFRLKPKIHNSTKIDHPQHLSLYNFDAFPLTYQLSHKTHFEKSQSEVPEGLQVHH